MVTFFEPVQLAVDTLAESLALVDDFLAPRLDAICDHLGEVRMRERIRQDLRTFLVIKAPVAGWDAPNAELLLEVEISRTHIESKGNQVFKDLRGVVSVTAQHKVTTAVAQDILGEKTC